MGFWTAFRKPKPPAPELLLLVLKLWPLLCERLWSLPQLPFPIQLGPLTNPLPTHKKTKLSPNRRKLKSKPLHSEMLMRSYYISYREEDLGQSDLHIVKTSVGFSDSTHKKELSSLVKKYRLNFQV